jgi:hypothetical protein
MDRSTWCLLLFAGLSFQLPLLLSYGLETTFVTLLLVWSLYFILTRNSNLAMLSIALLPLTRLDYCFFFPTLFLVAYLENRHFRASFALFVPALGLVLAYLSFARLYFGEMFPYSWIAKTYFPESVSGVLSWSVFFRARPASLWLIGGGAAAISAFAIANRRVPASIAHDEPNITFVGIVALLITGFAYIAVLQFQRAPDMPWYFVTFFCLLFLGLLYAIAHTQRRLLRTLLLVGLIALNLVLDLQTSKSFASKAGNQDRREKIGLYLRDNVPDITQKSILLYEVGKIPYYSGARTYDTLALVSREGIDGLKQNDASTLFLATLPDFVAGPNMPNYFPMSFLHNKAFTDNYARVIQVDDYVLWRKVTPRRDSDSK